MDNNNSDNKFHNAVLGKIKSGEVTMHSRAYFAWRAAFWVLGVVILAAAGAFVFSFIIFVLRASGTWDLTQFGGHGLREFLIFFPWLFVPAVLLFIWLMEILARKYSFAYKVPIAYLALVAAILIAGGGFIVLATPLHQRLLESANEDRLPLMGSVYRFFGDGHPDDFYVGDVEAASGTVYSIITREGYPATIVANPQTVFAPNTKPINDGDCIEVVGEESGKVVDAYNIKKIPPNSPYPIRHYTAPEPAQ